MKKLIMTIVVLALAAFGFFYYNSIQAPIEPGDVTIVIVDASDQIIYEEIHMFDIDDTLLGIMDETFDLSCANGNYQPTSCDVDSMFGTVILGIDDMNTDWTTDYIAIYINDEYGNYGIDSITLTDGDVYRFEYTLVEELTP